MVSICRRTNSTASFRICLYMKIRSFVPALLLGSALAGASALGFSQQPYPGEDHSAKQDMKNAGHETKQATKDAGNGVKHGTEKAYHSTKKETKKAYHKTKNTTKGAVDGAKEGAHQ